MSVTYEIDDRYCPSGHKWTRLKANLVFSDCYFCFNCDKVYQPTVQEVTKEWFKENYNTDRFNDIKQMARVKEAFKKVTHEDLIKMKLL
jgi:hypothetical protein